MRTTEEGFFRDLLIACNSKYLAVISWEDYASPTNAGMNDWWKCEADEYDVVRCPSHRCQHKENGGKVWPHHRSATREIVWRAAHHLRLDDDPMLVVGRQVLFGRRVYFLRWSERK